MVDPLRSPMLPTGIPLRSPMLPTGIPIRPTPTAEYPADGLPYGQDEETTTCTAPESQQS
jgi:hypothetical protein